MPAVNFFNIHPSLFGACSVNVLFCRSLTEAVSNKDRTKSPEKRANLSNFSYPFKTFQNLSKPVMAVLVRFCSASFGLRCQRYPGHRNLCLILKIASMGNYNKGILGPFYGKVGTVVGASWRGIDYMRSLPKKGNRTPTEVQLLQRRRFLTVSEFLAPINPVLRKFFGSNAGTNTRLNQAMSYHMKEAVNYAEPDFEILYNKVQISKGDLLGVQNPTQVSTAQNSINFSWEDNSGQGEAKATDQLVVVVYAPSANLYFYSLNAGTRSAENAAVALPAYFSGLEVQSWIAFAAADGNAYATSVYMGAVSVS